MKEKTVSYDRCKSGKIIWAKEDLYMKMNEAVVEKIKKKLFNSLKLSGFLVRREYCSLIVDRLQEEGIDLSNTSSFDEVIKKICSSLESQCVSDQSIEKEFVEHAIEACLNQGYDRDETIFSVIDAFDFPKLAYNFDRKQYYIDNKKPKLLGDAESKSELFINRYTTILQRTKRNFEQKIVNREAVQLKLQTIDYLLTLSNVTLDKTLILGSLSQLKEGKFFLEDPTGAVELDLTHAKFHGGFFCEQSMVLVNGYYEDKILHASTVVMPPGEEYEGSRNTFGNINYFGGTSKHLLRSSVKLKDEMNRDQSRQILFFSDLWLDDAVVFEKLQVLFEGLQDIPPVAFVFMGNFLSAAYGSEMMFELRRLFKQLGELISKYPNLVENSHFVFIPGFNDPCLPYAIPKFSLPNLVTNDLKKLVPKAVFTTNPCRIQYCTRQIVVFRANLVAKFLQGSLFKPPREEIGSCVTRTIVGQGHLSPFTLYALTVHWEFDYCLRLYPLPDLVVVGDKFEPYQGSYKGCEVINPGPFCEGGFQFKAYSPSSNEVADCDLD